jgi:hypothetical protein
MALVAKLLLCAALGQGEASGEDIRTLLKQADEKQGDERRDALHSLATLLIRNPSCKDIEALQATARAFAKYFKDFAGFPHSELRAFTSIVLSQSDTVTAQEVSLELLKISEGQDARLSQTAWEALADLVPKLAGQIVEKISQKMIASPEDPEAQSLHPIAISILGNAGLKLNDELLAKAVASVERFLQIKEQKLGAAWTLAKIGPGLADQGKGLAVQESAVDALAALLAEGGMSQLEASLAFRDVGTGLRAKAAWKAADALAKSLQDISKAIRGNCCNALIGIAPHLDLKQIADLRQRVPEASNEGDEFLRQGLNELLRALDRREEELRK